MSESKSVKQKEYATARDDLLLALRHERVSAQGFVYIYTDEHAMFRGHPEFVPYNKGWREFAEMLLNEEESSANEPSDYLGCFGWWPVLSILWDHFGLDWDMGHLYSPRDPSLSSRISYLQVNVADLVRTFTEDREERGGQNGTVQSQRRWGRPREYAWDSFYVEVAVTADLDGLPTAQADLEKQMASWCENTWGKQPTESTIRDKIAPIYRHPRKAGKADK